MSNSRDQDYLLHALLLCFGWIHRWCCILMCVADFYDADACPLLKQLFSLILCRTFMLMLVTFWVDYLIIIWVTALAALFRCNVGVLYFKRFIWHLSDVVVVVILLVFDLLTVDHLQRIFIYIFIRICGLVTFTCCTVRFIRIILELLGCMNTILLGTLKIKFIYALYSTKFIYF